MNSCGQSLGCSVKVERNDFVWFNFRPHSMYHEANRLRWVCIKEAANLSGSEVACNLLLIDQTCIQIKNQTICGNESKKVLKNSRKRDLEADENAFATIHHNSDRYFILEWTYTAMFYTFSCFVFCRLIYSESILKPYLDDLTLDNINYSLMTSLSVLIVLLNPLLANKARENREKYFKIWREYQIQYEQYSVSELNLGSSILIVLLIVGGTIITTLELVANCVLTSQLNPTYIYANWLIYFYTNLTTIQWVTDCHLLTLVSKKLLNQFLARTITVNSSGRIFSDGIGVETHVSHFVELWRKLSDMSSGLIDTGCGLYEFNFAVQSVIVVQALYGIVALYIGQHQSIVHYNVYFPTAAWSIINLVALCEAAYSVTNQVGFKTNIAIQSITCNNFSLETQEQIFTALKTIQSHIPVITVNGYFTMDRSYILSYLGVAVSYIIVLTQFKISTS
ncbi:uncharacterized protein LOC112603675 [Melanaphis sacchari]|uniref:uncharacterized protein LOC112603675 n=1 Tax=Melanaphis sacchari TaxID=742174 RepID=UPI000DC15A29|nr:uncharacterized protein LOC112603675 [Melanaphis sacchari]